MEPELIPSNTVHKNIWVIPLVIVVSALLAGGLVYIVENNKNTNTKNNLQVQIDTLKSKLAIVPTVSPTSSAIDTQTYTNTTYGYSIQYKKTLFIDSSQGNNVFSQTGVEGSPRTGGDIIWSNYSFPDSQYSATTPADFSHIYLEISQKTDNTQTLDAFLAASGMDTTSTTSFTTTSGVKGEMWVNYVTDKNGKNGFSNYAFQNGQAVYHLSGVSLNSTASAATITSLNSMVDTMALSFTLTK